MSTPSHINTPKKIASVPESIKMTGYISTAEMNPLHNLILETIEEKCPEFEFAFDLSNIETVGPIRLEDGSTYQG